MLNGSESAWCPPHFTTQNIHILANLTELTDLAILSPRGSPNYCVEFQMQKAIDRSKLDYALLNQFEHVFLAVYETQGFT